MGDLKGRSGEVGVSAPRHRNTCHRFSPVIERKPLSDPETYTIRCTNSLLQSKTAGGIQAPIDVDLENENSDE
jgi:hypothetical protein